MRAARISRGDFDRPRRTRPGLGGPRQRAKRQVDQGLYGGQLAVSSASRRSRAAGPPRFRRLSRPAAGSRTNAGPGPVTSWYEPAVEGVKRPRMPGAMHQRLRAACSRSRSVGKAPWSVTVPPGRHLFGGVAQRFNRGRSTSGPGRRVVETGESTPRAVEARTSRRDSNESCKWPGSMDLGGDSCCNGLELRVVARERTRRGRFLLGSPAPAAPRDRKRRSPGPAPMSDRRQAMFGAPSCSLGSDPHRRGVGLGCPRRRSAREHWAAARAWGGGLESQCQGLRRACSAGT